MYIFLFTGGPIERYRARTAQKSNARRPATRRAAVLAVTTATAALHSQVLSVPFAAASPLAALELPLSWTGVWSVQRSLDDISGDRQEAEKSWRLLGGSVNFAEGSTEHYRTRFIQADDAVAAFDWSFDVSSRAAIPESSMAWDGEALRLRYVRGELMILQREIYPPGASFGATELLSARQDLLTDGWSAAQRALRVSRAFRIDQSGVIRAREVVKTFDMTSATSSASADVGSTSITRSSLTMREITRPLGDSVRREPAYPESRGGYRGIASASQSAAA